ncbi:MAG: 6-phosphogluconolactonase [Deltaproteobacteria bacterium]|nr:6-phosphogluconolactonase [Deltaproteobacteria bacterium]
MTAVLLRCAAPGDVAVAARALVVTGLLEARGRSGTAALGLSGGSTPRALYERMALEGDPARLTGVHLFFGDERCVPPDHADSNARMAHLALTRHFPPDMVHRLRGEAADIDVEARRASAELQTCLGDRGLDVLLLGLGDDAHTASLFPGSGALTPSGERVVAVHEGTPRHRRLTVTPAEIARAAHVVVLVTGASKAAVLRRALADPVDIQAMPVQLALRLHPRCVVVCDAAAAP